MKSEVLQERIMRDDDFVLDETQKIQKLLKLKTEIRWEEERPLGDTTESVAEHIYGMHVVAQYFLPLEDPQESLDRSKIANMITWHDIDEIITGDIIPTKKTLDHARIENKAIEEILSEMPIHMRPATTEVLAEYRSQKSQEARFVKAVDKTEPIFKMFTPGFDRVLKNINRKAFELDKIIIQYITDFPSMLRFVNVNRVKAEAEGFFAD